MPAKPAGYEYIAQRGRLFRKWLKHRKVHSVYAMLPRKETRRGNRFYEATWPPPRHPDRAGEADPAPTR